MDIIFILLSNNIRDIDIFKPDYNLDKFIFFFIENIYLYKI